MFVLKNRDFVNIRGTLAKLLLQQPSTNIGEWHAQHVDSAFLEVNGVSLELPFIANDIETLQKDIGPNLPWAEDHFQERVCGTPLNPPPSSDHWPFAQKKNTTHKRDNQFSHTYPERFWPKHANSVNIYRKHQGIRYAYGDVMDVASLLARSPNTRQAFLPIWFPEDTGAVDGQRVPCSLGYHFMIRNGFLNCTYMIRSCDFMRHFVDDVYMAGRLMQWMSQQVNSLTIEMTISPGTLTMHIMNLHAFETDKMQLDIIARKWSQRFNGVHDAHIQD